MKVSWKSMILLILGPGRPSAGRAQNGSSGGDQSGICKCLTPRFAPLSLRSDGNFFQMRQHLLVPTRLTCRRQRCLEIEDNVFSFLLFLLFSPISRHFLLFILFLDTFSLISRIKSVQKREKTFFPIYKHFLSSVLFLDTFSLISRPKSVQKWDRPKIV